MMLSSHSAPLGVVGKNEMDAKTADGRTSRNAQASQEAKNLRRIAATPTQRVPAMMKFIPII